ncbi:MAG: CAP domain-containing protein [Desertifilum sp.]|nr:CAP domain-containing protein [Desertifilum sp.]
MKRSYLVLLLSAGLAAMGATLNAQTVHSQTLETVGKFRVAQVRQNRPGNGNLMAQSDIVALEQALHQQVNAYRQTQGLQPLQLDDRMSQLARTHSQNMASGGVAFGHGGSQQRFSAIAQQVPYSQVAENVAYNFGHSNPIEQAVQGWIRSSGHQRNMAGNYSLTGIGIARNARGEYYFTQIFVRPR